jgi:hypothetical protein
MRSGGGKFSPKRTQHIYKRGVISAKQRRKFFVNEVNES